MHPPLVARQLPRMCSTEEGALEEPTTEATPEPTPEPTKTLSPVAQMRKDAKKYAAAEAEWRTPELAQQQTIARVIFAVLFLGIAAL
eukprot:1039667-Prymnesium_polylepis.1